MIIPCFSVLINLLRAIPLFIYSYHILSLRVARSCFSFMNEKANYKVNLPQPDCKNKSLICAANIVKNRRRRRRRRHRRRRRRRHHSP